MSIKNDILRNSLLLEDDEKTKHIEELIELMNKISIKGNNGPIDREKMFRRFWTDFLGDTGKRYLIQRKKYEEILKLSPEKIREVMLYD